VGVQFGSTTWCKVVLISEMGNNNVFNVKLFSSESGLWCQEVVSCQHDFIFHYKHSSTSTICNGILHWFGPRCGIISYDPCNNNNADCFGFINLPKWKGF
jgi:hypothetical protein